MLVTIQNKISFYIATPPSNENGRDELAGAGGLKASFRVARSRDCPIAVEFWNKIVPYGRRNGFYMSNLSDWVSENVNNRSEGSNGLMWCKVCALSCYSLWNWRNKDMHEQNFTRPNNQVQHVIGLAKDYYTAVCANGVAVQRNVIIS
ncbi:putative ribonuclease H protein, partial [Trifolium medium]|nr:putative ribonuclease H protein [Trifolium medium]